MNPAQEKETKDRQEAPESILSVAKLLPNFVACWHHPELCQERLNKLGQSIGKTLKEVKILQGETYKENEKDKALLFINKLECKLIALLNPKNAPSQQLTILKDLIPLACTILGSDNPLVKTLEDPKLSMLLKQAAYSYTVEDTDDWQDMLLIGTEIEGSCQSIHSAPNNKCLLGYISDGKYRAVVVKDSNGRIVGRCILRLLWDPAKKVPVLLREIPFVNNGAPLKTLAAINELAAERARALGIEIVHGANRDFGEIPREKLYGAPLHSLGSPAPYEYLDIGSIGVSNGRYEIASNHIVKGVANN